MGTFTIIMNKFISLWQARSMRCIGPLINIDDVLAKVSEKPTHLGFEVTNICNARCVFCGYQYLERQKVVLPIDLFKKGLDEFDAFGGGSIGFNPIVGIPSSIHILWKGFSTQEARRTFAELDSLPMGS